MLTLWSACLNGKPDWRQAFNLFEQDQTSDLAHTIATTYEPHRKKIMDPAACWDEINGLLNQDRVLDDADHHRIGELAESLRQWLTRGGFIPRKLKEAGLNREGCLRVLSACASNYN